MTAPIINESLSVFARIPTINGAILNANDFSNFAKPLDEITKEAHLIASQVHSASRNETIWTTLLIVAVGVSLLALIYLLFKIKPWRIFRLCLAPCNYYNCFNNGGTQNINTSTAPQYSVHFQQPSIAAITNETAPTYSETREEPHTLLKPCKKKVLLKPII